MLIFSFRSTAMAHERGAMDRRTQKLACNRGGRQTAPVPTTTKRSSGSSVGKGPKSVPKNAKTFREKKVKQISTEGHMIKRNPRSDEKEKQVEKAKRKLKFDHNRKLVRGCRIGTSKFTFTIKKLLGSGGFGDVYLVEDKTGKEYAVKTEYRDASVTPRLHFEVKAYTVINKCKEKNPEKVIHLLEMRDSACTDSLKYIVMTLVGPSIEDLIAKIEISWSTACRLCIEMFEGLQELHAIGLVHRDVKPANYSIGLGPQKRRVFLVDLGTTTFFPTEEKQIKKNSKYKFIGTLRYASRTTHLAKRQTRKDDLEAWLYTAMEMFLADALPWRNSDDEKEVGKMKDDLFKNPKAAVENVPSRLLEIIKMIDEVEPLQSPNYPALRESLMKLAKEEDTVFGEPFEWETEPAVSKKKQVSEKEANPILCGPTLEKDKIDDHEGFPTAGVETPAHTIPARSVKRMLSERTCEE